jgi:succinoglycan biosynthesis transport protein ExoP
MNFQQFLTILMARKKIALIVLAVTVLTTLLVSLVMPKSYKATTTLVLDYKATDPVSGMTLPAQLMPGYMATQVDIISSRNVALKVVDMLGLTRNPTVIEAFNDDTQGEGDIREWLVDVLSKKLDVKPSGESSAIDLSYQNEDPKFAAALANAFADAYIQTNLQLKIEPSKRAAEWFNEQVKSLRDNLLKTQNKLSAYQREKGIVSVDERLDVENARLAELTNQLVLAQAQTFDSSSKQKQMYSGKRLDQLSTDVSGSQQREASIRAELSAQKARLLELSQQRDELGIMQGDVVNAQKVLDMGMQRFSQTNLEGQANQSEVAVLDSAFPPMEIYRPKLLLNLLISIFLGSMLAVGFTYLAEMRDRRIRAPGDLSLALGLPVLGVIAAAKPPRKSRLKRFFRNRATATA